MAKRKPEHLRKIAGSCGYSGEGGDAGAGRTSHLLAGSAAPACVARKSRDLIVEFEGSWPEAIKSRALLLLNRQKGSCAICQRSFRLSSTGPLVADEDKPGHLAGVLCEPCSHAVMHHAATTRYLKDTR